ncbi:MAG: coiled-coil protein, partial [Candidatus Thorarchaeota archaeon]
MTEAADAKPEDIEFLRARLRELKIQAREDLEVLRRDRDQMRQYKAVRDEHNKEVRSLIESVKAEREERDRINKEISEAKDRRSAIHAQLKSVYEEIRELRSNIVGSPSTDQRRMMRRVEELEWRQQTEQLSMDEERSIVEEIAKIEAKLVKIGQEKEKQDRIHEQRRLARRLKEEASEAHQRVLKLSEQSQIHHQEVVRIRPQLEEFKRSADTAHQNFVEWLKKVKDGETKLKEVRTEIDEIYGKIRKFESERRDTAETERREEKKFHEQERVDAAVEKMQSGGRLTFDEFILAQRSVTDDKRG